MRIKHFFGLAVIAAMTASCSSNNDLVVGGGNGSGENESGASYASITINLPTANGTRAQNDQFAGGTASEYAVNDATLLIFEKGTADSEQDFKFVEAVPLGNLEPWKKDDTANNGITTEATITAELNSATVDEAGGKYYALVILNNETATDTKIKLPTASTESPVTYGKWNVASNATNITDYTKGFYMANAPEFKDADKEPTTLVPIKGIYRTKEEAHSKPGTTVHVERGLAKVTVGKGTGDDYFTGAKVSGSTGSKYSNDKVQITNWALDVTNKKSFPVHVTSGLKAGITLTDPVQTVPAYPNIWKNEEATAGTTPATSRFVSNSTTATFKRVYWGIDPNYSMGLIDLAKCKEQFTIVNADGSDATWKSSTDPLYCLENTFDIKNMKQGQTTRVLLKATYTPNALATATDKTFFMIGNSSDIWTKDNLIKQITSKAKEALKTTAELTVVLKGDLLAAGTHVLTTENVSIKEGEGETATEKVDADLVAKLNTKLGLDATNGFGIKTYKNGESYYIARIKHFGDELTPWAAGDEIYGGKNLNWLGRYGVLRNNWYDLTINKISGPGYPDVPEVKPETPDDEDTKYINVSVKILDWAKRSQSVDL